MRFVRRGRTAATLASGRELSHRRIAQRVLGIPSDCGGDLERSSFLAAAGEPGRRSAAEKRGGGHCSCVEERPQRIGREESRASGTHATVVVDVQVPGTVHREEQMSAWLVNTVDSFFGSALVTRLKRSPTVYWFWWSTRPAWYALGWFYKRARARADKRLMDRFEALGPCPCPKCTNRREEHKRDSLKSLLDVTDEEVQSALGQLLYLHGEGLSGPSGERPARRPSAPVRQGMGSEARSKWPNDRNFPRLAAHPKVKRRKGESGA
jgi:hypothetical protein